MSTRCEATFVSDKWSPTRRLSEPLGCFGWRWSYFWFSDYDRSLVGFEPPRIGWGCRFEGRAVWLDNGRLELRKFVAVEGSAFRFQYSGGSVECFAGRVLQISGFVCNSRTKFVSSATDSFRRGGKRLCPSRRGVLSITADRLNDRERS